MIVDAVLGALGGLAALGTIWAAMSIRVVQQFQKGVVFRFGKVRDEVREPGLVALMPVADRLRRVNVQIVTMPIPAQEGITRDNVTVRVDAVVYFRVVDPVKATVNVQDYNFAISQVAQTSLRSIIGKSELDDLLANREPINQGLELMIDSPALGWGVEIDRVEIKDVALPESMKRSIARQAEAERERRARIITADGEYQASERLSDAAAVMSATPSALQLRLLQTVVEVAAEKNSTLVLPFPVELLRFLESATEAQQRNLLTAAAAAVGAKAAEEAVESGEVSEEEVEAEPPRHEIPPLEELLEHSPLDEPNSPDGRPGRGTGAPADPEH
ncbi:slipin family protein [Kitasatospora sp. NPDC096140]|uniref:slipin family protein n=1 Tax=Kitasatospora sp. NPDC096140 TaxID=3155425 RepID=UPI00332DD181